MGRLVTFMSRILKDVDAQPPSTARGIGVDEHTALLLNPTNGDVSIVGVGSAYVCASDHQASVCEPSKALTFEGVQCVRLNAKLTDRFSFANWNGDGVKYVIDVVSGVITTDAYGPITAPQKI